MTYISDKRLCVNQDSTKIVDCDSPDAAYLLVGEGGELTDEQAKKYGLGASKAKAKEEEAPAEEKAVAATPENKAVAAPEDTKRKVSPATYTRK